VKDIVNAYEEYSSRANGNNGNGDSEKNHLDGNNKNKQSEEPGE
jgi:hypothetical protein